MDRPENFLLHNEEHPLRTSFLRVVLFSLSNGIHPEVIQKITTRKFRQTFTKFSSPVFLAPRGNARA